MNDLTEAWRCASKDLTRILECLRCKHDQRASDAVLGQTLCNHTFHDSCIAREIWPELRQCSIAATAGWLQHPMLEEPPNEVGPGRARAGHRGEPAAFAVTNTI